MRNGLSPFPPVCGEMMVLTGKPSPTQWTGGAGITDKTLFALFGMAVSIASNFESRLDESLTIIAAKIEIICFNN
jgi:hypothetical protein